MAEIVVNGVNFTYREVSYGTNRGISVNTTGATPVEYKFDPNPHKNRKYNKKQAQFYREAAESIGTYYTENNHWPPFDHQITALDVVYTLTER